MPPLPVGFGFAIGLLAVVLLLALIAQGRPLVNIGGEQVGIRERRYLGRRLPAGRVVATGGEVGIQAQVLKPGLKLQFPYLYRVESARWW